MDIVLHMLSGYLLASKAYLNCHLKETAEFDRQSQTVSNLGVPGQPETPEVTREELKNALLAAQVSNCHLEATLCQANVKLIRKKKVCSHFGNSVACRFSL